MSVTLAAVGRLSEADDRAAQVLGLVLDRAFPGTTVETLQVDEGNQFVSIRDPSGYLNFCIEPAYEGTVMSGWWVKNYGEFRVPRSFGRTVQETVDGVTGYLEMYWFRLAQRALGGRRELAA